MHSLVKPTGDISSAFSNLGGQANALDPTLLSLKKQLVDPDLIQKAYDRLLASMQTSRAITIPQVTLEELNENHGQFTKEVADAIRLCGCVVIRNVIPTEEAHVYRQQVKQYIHRHPYDTNKVNCFSSTIGGFPKHSPQVFEAYWSQPQLAIRGQLGFKVATVALNHLWHADTAVDWTHNLAYCDRVQIHQSGEPFFGPPTHVDNGSLERWQDTEYRKCYTDILKGEWEHYDPFDATHRISACMDHYGSLVGPSVFRSFQGCIVLSEMNTGSGTLQVCPLLKEATALFMMKPLTKEYIDKLDYVGAYPGLCHHITKENYPEIVNNLVTLPDLQPGDAVFWHCDQVYSFEPENQSREDTCILYVSSVPVCPVNSKYIKLQRDAFLAGLTPPDFPGNHCEEKAKGRARPKDLNEQAKQSMGLAKLPESPDASESQKEAIDFHHRILGYF
ncbi:hypothetical protein BD560DRAFT_397722 [Blakeslea trispora]|nr:hypothetical protein BD560DRAFT_397722 [Blakeslea trispora]